MSLIRHSMSRALLVTSLSAFGADALAQEFHYSGDEGPGNWSEISEDWQACAGTAADARQSPIDISRARPDRTLKALQVVTYPTTIDVFNNGHTIEQHYAGTGTSITFEGRYYELSQFHFHTYSEHQVGGEHGEMEMHGVFQEPDGGDYLVIGVLFQAGGQQDDFLQTLIDAGLPAKDGDTTVSEDWIDIGDAFTTRKSYFTYPGSLTTPPCTETVTWVVLAKSRKMSTDQFQAFRDILGNNFRPVQDLNGRTVRASKGAMPKSDRKSDNKHD